MSNELPNLDEDISFVVDDGAPTGPMPMRAIIDSIRSGERAPDVLVWWAGTPEWVGFASHPGLFDLLQALPATNQPPPPPLDLGEAELADQADQAAPAEDAPVEDAPAEAEGSSFPEPEVTTFEMAADEALFDPEIEAQADAILGGDPRSMHPSSGWGVNDDSAEAVVHEPAEVDEPAEAAEPEPEVDEPAEAAAEVNAAAEEPAPQSGLIGLFSADARTTGGVTRTRTPAESLDAVISARSSLENVGARINALTSATRRAQQLDHELDPVEPAGAVSIVEETEQLEPLVENLENVEPIADHVDATDEPPAPDVDASDAEIVADAPDETPTGSWHAVDEAAFEEEAALVDDAPAVASDLDQRFAEMVRRSVEHQRRIDWATRIDELLLSASITSIVDDGFVVVDLTTIERQHHVVFDHNDDSRRVRLDLSPLSTLNAAGDPVGRHVRVAMTWGREVADADAAFAVVRSEVADGEVLPGTVTCEADLVNSKAFTKVELIWAAEEFVSDDHSVDRDALDASIAAALHALEVRWHELFVDAR